MNELLKKTTYFIWKLLRQRKQKKAKKRIGEKLSEDLNMKMMI